MPIERENSRYSVIDGQQRLNAIYNYFTNNYPLEGLELLWALNGKHYKELPQFLIRRLEERTLKFTRVDSTADPKVKIDIFERLNSGSIKLTMQELRNALFNGNLNSLCKELSKEPNFRRLLQIKGNKIDKHPKVQKMEDVDMF